MSDDKSTPAHKTCSKCGETKPTEGWPPRKSSRDGLHGWCRECQREYSRLQSRKWRASNLERHRANNRARYAANPDKFRAVKRAYDEANRDLVNERARRAYHENGGLEASRKRRNANPEPSREACRRWYRKNRQKVLDAMHQRRMAVDAGYVSDGFVDWLTEQPCAYCAAAGPSEIDHVVPVSRGGDHDEMNLVPACRRCNASKGSRLLSEWKEG